MRSYHFDIGNSTEGPIGYCARVLAESEEQALGILRESLEKIEREHAVFDDLYDDPSERPVKGLEYIRVYFNPDKLTVKDIFDSEEREPEADDCDPLLAEETE